MVCSAAVITLDCGALATTMPRRVAASTSTLSTPTPARPTAFRFSALSSSSAVSLVAERMRMPSNSPIRRSSSPGLPVGAQLHVESRVAQQLHAGLADLLGHEHARHAATSLTFSTTQSTQAVRACTSSGSTAGNIPTRSWLRPSLR